MHTSGGTGEANICAFNVGMATLVDSPELGKLDSKESKSSAVHKREPRIRRYKICRLQIRAAALSGQAESVLLEGRQLITWKRRHVPALTDLTEEDRAVVDASHALRLADLTQKTCAVVIKALMAHKWSFPFNQPVDTDRFPDYRKVVSTPMDLGTLRTRCEAGMYREPRELYADLMLIFNNAKLFNPPGTDCFLMAQTLQEFAQEKWDKAVVPKVAEEAALVAREEAACRQRRLEAAHGQELTVVEQQAERLLTIVDELQAAVGEARSLAASLVEPVPAQQKRALADALRLLPTHQLEAAIAYIASRQPALKQQQQQQEADSAASQVDGDGLSTSLQVQLDTYDALLLRQLQHFVTCCVSANKASALPAKEKCVADNAASIEHDAVGHKVFPTGSGSIGKVRVIADVVHNAALSCSNISARAGITWPGLAVGAGLPPVARSSLLLPPEGALRDPVAKLASGSAGAAPLAAIPTTLSSGTAAPTPNSEASISVPAMALVNLPAAPAAAMGLRPSLKRRAAESSDPAGSGLAVGTSEQHTKKPRSVTLVSPAPSSPTIVADEPAAPTALLIARPPPSVETANVSPNVRPPPTAPTAAPAAPPPTSAGHALPALSSSSGNPAAPSSMASLLSAAPLPPPPVPPQSRLLGPSRQSPELPALPPLPPPLGPHLALPLPSQQQHLRPRGFPPGWAPPMPITNGLRRPTSTPSAGGSLPGGLPNTPLPLPVLDLTTRGAANPAAATQQSDLPGSSVMPNTGAATSMPAASTSSIAAGSGGGGSGGSVPMPRWSGLTALETSGEIPAGGGRKVLDLSNARSSADPEPFDTDGAGPLQEGIKPGQAGQLAGLTASHLVGVSSTDAVLQGRPRSASPALAQLGLRNGNEMFLESMLDQG